MFSLVSFLAVWMVTTKHCCWGESNSDSNAIPGLFVRPRDVTSAQRYYGHNSIKWFPVGEEGTGTSEGSGGEGQQGTNSGPQVGFGGLCS